MSTVQESSSGDERPPVIAGVGLATAQGSAADLLAGAAMAPPEQLPWPANRWTTSRLCRPARGLDPGLTGPERWRVLARQALAECCEYRGGSPPPDGTPLVVASCNGAAPSFEAEAWRRAFDTAGVLGLQDIAPWARVRPAVASAACASGLQGLFLARLLLEAGAGEVVVLAVDILSPPAQAHFESLRILAPELQTPWQPLTEGFLFGEAAVALRLRRGGPGARLHGPALSQDLNGGDGLDRALDAFRFPGGIDLILGQGTGPPEVDRVELAAVRRAVPDLGVPLTSTLFHFGHTLGSSGLLSLALAALQGTGPMLAALALPDPEAADGRALLHRSGGIQPDRRARSLVVCRALGGACAAAALTGDGETAREAPSPVRGWAAPVPPGPIHHPLLGRLAEEALRHRPEEPPDLLIVRLAEPLTPPPRAVVGGRLLPSAVLEITPGRTALQIAQGWGYQGPALCLVDGDISDDSWLAALARSGRHVNVVNVHPGYDHVEWS